MPNYCVILPAAGQSTRFGNEHGKKVFARLLEHPVWVHSAMRFAKRADVTQILLVISPEDRAYVEQEFASQLETLKVDLIDGGAERYDSIANALSQVNDSIDYIAVRRVLVFRKSRLMRSFKRPLRIRRPCWLILFPEH